MNNNTDFKVNIVTLPSEATPEMITLALFGMTPQRLAEEIAKNANGKWDCVREDPQGRV